MKPVPLKFEIASPEHEIAFQDICRLLNKHGAKIDAAEMLAIAANMIGKLIALQDQRTMTKDRALELVIRNLELGNEQAVAQMNNPAGTA